MSDAPNGFTVEPEPERNTLTLRVQRVVLNAPEILDAAMPSILAGFQAMGWQPCYILMDITGLRITPRVRTYLAAQGKNTVTQIRALIVFSAQPDPVTELLLRIGAAYDNIPYFFAPDEATARAEIARRQAEASGQCSEIGGL
jgi:hypothetical protein